MSRMVAIGPDPDYIRKYHEHDSVTNNIAVTKGSLLLPLSIPAWTARDSNPAPMTALYAP